MDLKHIHTDQQPTLIGSETVLLSRNSLVRSTGDHLRRSSAVQFFLCFSEQLCRWGKGIGRSPGLCLGLIDQVEGARPGGSGSD